MPYAIDLFCGAGGFSEGILQAGFDIIFSSDKSPMVEETYTNRHEQLGLVEGVDTHFELADIKELTADKIFEEINNLRYGPIFERGTVDVIFGGPPCQGFSRLGKRDSKDPRNMLFHEYLRIIRDVNPRYVVMENVTGILDMNMLDFPSVLNKEKIYEGQHIVPKILEEELTGLGYTVLDIQVLNAADFGVPQQRNRAVFLAYRNDVAPIEYPIAEGYDAVNVREALGDLYPEYNYTSDFSQNRVNGETPNVNNTPLEREEINNMETSHHDAVVVERFSLYRQGEKMVNVVTRLRESGIDLRREKPALFNEALFQLNKNDNLKAIKKTISELDIVIPKTTRLPFLNKILSNSMLVRDEDARCKLLKQLSSRLGTDIDTVEEFLNRIRGRLNPKVSADEFAEKLINGDISDEEAIAIFTKKNVRIRLDAEKVAPTIVTLPDDYIHPFFNRTLTVREMARIQSFDDSFLFLGKRTTGGSKRKLETPQFTQVGNAVPPLLAKAIAGAVLKGINEN
ncbi:DNA cytosine methyltransferase [Ligilactobacillus equi]